MNKMAMILAVSLVCSSQAAFSSEVGSTGGPAVVDPVVVAPVVAPTLPATLIFVAVGVAGVAAAASGGSTSTPQH